MNFIFWNFKSILDMHGSHLKQVSAKIRTSEHVSLTRRALITVFIKKLLPKYHMMHSTYRRFCSVFLQKLDHLVIFVKYCICKRLFNHHHYHTFHTPVRKARISRNCNINHQERNNQTIKGFETCGTNPDS